MGIFVSVVRHNCDQKTAMENKIQNNVMQYKIGKYSCDIRSGGAHKVPLKVVFVILKYYLWNVVYTIPT
jgi:hypothetical protein